LANWLTMCGAPADEQLVARLEQAMQDSLGDLSELNAAAG